MCFLMIRETKIVSSSWDASATCVFNNQFDLSIRFEENDALSVRYYLLTVSPKPFFSRPVAFVNDGQPTKEDPPYLDFPNTSTH